MNDETPANIAAATDIDSGLACLVMLLRFLSIPADPEQLRHQFARRGAKFSSTEILRAAKRAGVKARRVSTKWARLPKTPLPAIAEHREGRFFVLAKVGFRQGSDPRSAVQPTAHD